jgi:molybdopterin-binding protein
LNPILEIHSLEVKRAGNPVLNVEHLALINGEVLAVIGPNGAGKSTLLLAIARLIKPDAGRIEFRGQPLEAQDELTYRRRIGLVLQDPLLLDTTVFNNIATGLRYRRLPRAQVAWRVEEWLDRLGIAHLSSRPARKLSGGEAQRVSLARALALQPELLLLDEPFSALDAPTRTRLLDDLQSLLAATRITTVFITHDQDEAMLLGHRVAVLLAGHLRQVGPPQQVFSAPADGDVAAFVGVETVIAGQVVDSSQGKLVIKTDGLLLEAVGELDVGRRVLFCLRPEDVTLWPAGGSPASSARNRLNGTIQRMTPVGPLVRVVLDCDIPLVALITRASAGEMGLTEGMQVTAAFKASAVHLIPR